MTVQEIINLPKYETGFKFEKIEDKIGNKINFSLIKDVFFHIRRMRETNLHNFFYIRAIQRCELEITELELTILSEVATDLDEFTCYCKEKICKCGAKKKKKEI